MVRVTEVAGTPCHTPASHTVQPTIPSVTCHAGHIPVLTEPASLTLKDRGVLSVGLPSEPQPGGLPEGPAGGTPRAERAPESDRVRKGTWAIPLQDTAAASPAPGLRTRPRSCPGARGEPSSVRLLSAQGSAVVTAAAGPVGSALNSGRGELEAASGAGSPQTPWAHRVPWPPHERGRPSVSRAGIQAPVVPCLSPTSPSLALAPQSLFCLS